MSIELRNEIAALKQRVEKLEQTCVLLTDRCRELGVDTDEALNVANSRPTLTLPEKRKSA